MLTRKTRVASNTRAANRMKPASRFDEHRE
jgi:hypothetical protein